jgi:hypothetical protein
MLSKYYRINIKISFFLVFIISLCESCRLSNNSSDMNRNELDEVIGSGLTSDLYKIPCIKDEVKNKIMESVSLHPTSWSNVNAGHLLGFLNFGQNILSTVRDPETLNFLAKRLSAANDGGEVPVLYENRWKYYIGVLNSQRVLGIIGVIEYVNNDDRENDSYRNDFDSDFINYKDYMEAIDDRAKVLKRLKYFNDKFAGFFRNFMSVILGVQRDRILDEPFVSSSIMSKFLDIFEAFNHVEKPNRGKIGDMMLFEQPHNTSLFLTTWTPKRIHYLSQIKDNEIFDKLSLYPNEFASYWEETCYGFYLCKQEFDNFYYRSIAAVIDLVNVPFVVNNKDRFFNLLDKIKMRSGFSTNFLTTDRVAALSAMKNEGAIDKILERMSENSDRFFAMCPGLFESMCSLGEVKFENFFTSVFDEVNDYDFEKEDSNSPNPLKILNDIELSTFDKIMDKIYTGNFLYINTNTITHLSKVGNHRILDRILSLINTENFSGICPSLIEKLCKIEDEIFIEKVCSKIDINNFVGVGIIDYRLGYQHLLSDLEEIFQKVPLPYTVTLSKQRMMGDSPTKEELLNALKNIIEKSFPRWKDIKPLDLQSFAKYYPEKFYQQLDTIRVNRENIVEAISNFISVLSSNRDLHIIEALRNIKDPRIFDAIFHHITPQNFHKISGRTIEALAQIKDLGILKFFLKNIPLETMNNMRRHRLSDLVTDGVRYMQQLQQSEMVSLMKKINNLGALDVLNGFSIEEISQNEERILKYFLQKYRHALSDISHF